MPSAVNEVIMVEEVKEGKYGPFAKVGGKYYNKGKQFKGNFDDMKAGNTYEVEVYTTESGGKYIQKLIAMHRPEGSVPPKQVEEVKKSKDKPVFKATTTRDYDAEAKGKTRCAVIEAALSSPALAAYCGSFDEYKKMLVEAANLAYAYVFPNE